MSEFTLFDKDLQGQMLRNAGMSEEKVAKYVNENKHSAAPAAKKLDESKKIVVAKKADAKPVKKAQTLAEMKAEFKKEMERLINEAFDPMKPAGEEDPLAAAGAPPAPPAGDAGLPPAGDAGLPPAPPTDDLGLDAGAEGGDLGMEGGDSEGLKTEIKDKFAELAAKLGEEEKNAFANELMEILFPGSTTEISGEGGEMAGDAGLPPAGDEGMPPAPEGSPMDKEEDELEDDDLL